MSSSALASQGMTIGISNTTDSPGEYDLITEVSELSGPGGQAAEIDVTDLSSTAKEFRMGLQDEGQLTMSLNWIPTNTQHAELRTQRTNGTLTYFELTFTDSPVTKWRFSAFVLGLELSNSVDDVTKASVTLRISGAITEL